MVNSRYSGKKQPEFSSERSLSPKLRSVNRPRYKTSVIFVPHRFGMYSVPNRIPIATLAMNSFMEIVSSIPLHWWIVSSIGALTIVAVCMRAFETDRSRAKRTERKKKTELRLLPDQISVYGVSIHQRYPTGDVIV